MFTTKHGEMIDFENQFVNFDGQEYSIRDLTILKNIYMQFVTAEFILENNEEYSEEQAWELAGITREKMDKYDMSEEDAIEEATKDYFERIKPIQDKKSYEKDWDFSQFTEEQFNFNGKPYAVKAATTALHNIGKDWDDEDYEYFEDIPFSSNNNDMFIKYKDLYVVPRIFCNSDDENIVLLLDVYIPKKNLLKMDNPKSIFQGCPYFDADYIEHDEYNQILVDRINGEPVAVECVPVSIETVEYLHDKYILNAEGLFASIKDIIKDSNPELIFDDFKAYFNARSSLEEKASNQIHNGTGFTEEEINNLVAAGDWHIDLGNYDNVAKSLAQKAAGDPYIIEEGDQLGYVAFGNDFYTMNVYEDGGVPGQYVCEMMKRFPADGTDATEIKDFKFDTIFVNELDYKYVGHEDECHEYNEVRASFVIDHNNMLPGNVEELKKATVEQLAYCHEINKDLANEYEDIKYSGKSFYSQLKAREKSLELLNDARQEFPVDIVKKDKLSPLDFEKLAEYYKKITPLVTDGKDSLFEDRLMAKEMINDGLTDVRIKAVTMAMIPGNAGCEYSHRISGLLADPDIKKFRKEIEYHKTHTGHPEKQR